MVSNFIATIYYPKFRPSATAEYTLSETSPSILYKLSITPSSPLPPYNHPQPRVIRCNFQFPTNPHSIIIMTTAIARSWFIFRISQLINMSPKSVNTATWRRNMTSLFGICSLSTLLFVWSTISVYGPEDVHMEHFLMGLFFLKVYPLETVACGVFHVQLKTWRKWVKVVVQRISNMELVSCILFFIQHT